MQFASVMENMAKNIAWTSSLGEAYHNQASDVMAAVQTACQSESCRQS
jgi:hypothetical protein